MVSFLGCVCTDCCDYVAISGAAEVQSTSIFAKTNITFNNRPVYKTSDGLYLHYDSVVIQWLVGRHRSFPDAAEFMQSVYLISPEDVQCPSDVTTWWVWTSADGWSPSYEATAGCTAPTTGASPGCPARLHNSCSLSSFVSVNCGGHMAPDCTACPTTACPAGSCGSGWCQGECSWDFSIDTCGHPSASFTLHPPYCLFDAASSTLRFNAGNYTGMPKFCGAG